MNLHILNSNSAGNGYILTTNKGKSIIIEAGVPFKKANSALDGNIENVHGLLITHEHGDHCGHVKEYTDHGIKVYASAGTIEAIIGKHPELEGSHLLHTLNPHSVETKCIGDGFIVRPFDVVHDAKEPLGFLIRHPESGYILFVTDTHYLNKRFPGIHNFIIECNYCEDILEHNIGSGKVPGLVGRRVKDSHLSIQTLQQFFSMQDTTHTSKVVLTHLSDHNSDEIMFAERIQKQLRTSTYCARAGLNLTLNRHPF